MHPTIAEAILDGIYKAHEVQWIRAGESIFDPAESVYLCQIADSIFKKGYKLQYEYKTRELIKELGLSDHNITASKGKIDLLIRTNKEQPLAIKQPLAIIEIKAEYAQERALEKDLFRICDLLQNRSREKFPDLFGVFAVGLRRCRKRFQKTDIRSHIKESFESIEKKVVKVKTGSKGCIYKPYEWPIVDKENIVWGASCFVIHSSPS